MRKMLHPSLTLGARQPYLDATSAALSRIDIILHTRPGDLPWSPRFGCELTSLVGESATTQRVNATRFSVESAIGAWLPDVNVRGCEVQLITGQGDTVLHREAAVPLAESALVSLGTEARLELKLDIEVDNQSLEVGTDLEFE